MLRKLFNWFKLQFEKNRNKRIFKATCREYSRLLNKQGYTNSPLPGEADYINLWSQLTKRVEPYSYRLYSHYIGNKPTIVPDYIGRRILCYYLNPPRYSDFYEDKNTYSSYIPFSSQLPENYLFRMGGGNLIDYQILTTVPSQFGISSTDLATLPKLQNVDKLILKPTIDSCSGHGVLLFSRTDNQFVSNNSDILDGKFLKSYSDDFVIQEAIEQHPDLAKLNPTSVNTLRICTYRSVIDEQIYVSGAVIRVGKKGSVVDNAHAGGCFIGLDLETGQLQHTAHDHYGGNYSSWNSIDYENGTYSIPNWDAVKKFATNVAKCNLHSRLLALDLTVDNAGTPRLIEVNIEGFSYWFFLFCGQDIFVGQTQDVIDYCKERMTKDGRNKLV